MEMRSDIRAAAPQVEPQKTDVDWTRRPRTAVDGWMDALQRCSGPAGDPPLRKIKVEIITRLSGHIKGAINHRCTNLGVKAQGSSEASVPVVLINPLTYLKHGVIDWDTCNRAVKNWSTCQSLNVSDIRCVDVPHPRVSICSEPTMKAKRTRSGEK